MRRVAGFFIFSIMLGISGCDISGFVGARSGTLEDDYVEEPLSAGVEKFETALNTSNDILQLMSRAGYDDIHRIYFSEAMKAQMSKRQFRQMMATIEQAAGPFKAYKAMQWHFFSNSEQGVDLLFSIKIAEHERARIKYILVFENKKPYIDLVGLHAREYQGVAAPGQL